MIGFHISRIAAHSRNCTNMVAICTVLHLDNARVKESRADLAEHAQYARQTHCFVFAYCFVGCADGTVYYRLFSACCTEPRQVHVTTEAVADVEIMKRHLHHEVQVHTSYCSSA